MPAGHEARVQNERPFDVELGTDELGELWGGSIDRLVLHLVDGRVVGAEVIDYKSNAVDAAGVQACAAGYAAQLDSYRRAVCAMYALAPEVVRASTLFVRPGVRHDYLLD